MGRSVSSEYKIGLMRLEEAGLPRSVGIIKPFSVARETIAHPAKKMTAAK
jgi:hypothetical protein